MSTAPIHVEVTVQDLSLQALVDRVQADTAGAIATFSGVTRNNFDGRPVLHLDYEAYTPMAEKKLQAISEAACARWQLQGVAIAHRVGRVAVGQTSVVIAVSSAHRRDALEACHWLIDELKAEVPIWKKETFTDGEVWKSNASGPAERLTTGQA